MRLRGDGVESMYPVCGICGKGTLLPVKIGTEEDPGIKYMCTNPQCGARFDQYGYEVYNNELQVWERRDIG